MTGGEVVILGRTGPNFGAGMTGGMAFIYDEDELFLSRANPETLQIAPVATAYWQKHLKALITLHVAETDSALAKRLLNNWTTEVKRFWHVVPTEVLGMLPNPLSDVEQESVRA